MVALLCCHFAFWSFLWVKGLLSWTESDIILFSVRLDFKSMYLSELRCVFSVFFFHKGKSNGIQGETFGKTGLNN